MLFHWEAQYSKKLWTWIGIFFISASITGTFIPPIGSTKERERRIQCASHLKQIGVALHLYAQRNEKCFPEVSTLETFNRLIKQGYINNPELLECPACIPKKKFFWSDYFKKKIDELKTTHYEYYPGLKDDPDSQAVPLIIDRTGNHFGKYRNCLFTDNHVEGNLYAE